MSDGLSRRSFMKIAAAAGAAAAIPGCAPAARKLIPYVVPDENVIPGVPSYYATTCTECGAGCGVIAKIREGRTINLAGNPGEPISTGAICARGTSALQGLYNPDRFGQPQRRGGDGRLTPISWDAALKEFNDQLAQAAAAGANRVAYYGVPQGPTIGKVIDAFLQTYKSNRKVIFEPLSDEPARNAGAACFNRRDLPVYRLDQAEAIVSFGADFVETWESPVEYARQYAEFRAPKQRRGHLSIGRAVYVGPRMNLSAAKMDEWVACTPGSEGWVAMGVLNVLVNQGYIKPNSGVDLSALRSFVAAYDPESAAQKSGIKADDISRMARYLGQADGGLALAAVSDQMAATAAYLINYVTGNYGRTMMYLDGAPAPEHNPWSDVKALLAAMQGGEIDVLLVAEGNPVYSLPPAAHFVDAAAKVKFVVWLGQVQDETAGMAHLLLPIHHKLETWRDIHPRAGLYGLGQPVMQPVFPSKPLGDILIESAHTGGATTAAIPWENAADAIKASWQAMQPKLAPTSNATDFWWGSLREGGSFTQAKTSTVALNAAVLKTAAPDAPPAGVALSAFPHIFMYDGRGADKPWLQEIPEPVEQIVWDNWAQVHPDTARSLAVADNDVVALTTGEGTGEVAVFISERVRPGVIAVPFGQGHTAYGRYAKGRGMNAFQLLAPGSWTAAVKVRNTGKKYKLVTALSGDDMMHRGIVKAMSLNQLEHGIIPPERNTNSNAPQPWEQYPHFSYPEHMWGMTIDNQSCVGCSACVAACYSENNIQFVGKDGVNKRRVMSWIRVERYAPPKDNPEEAPLLYITPMLCQQCDHAPCEPVCPVFASYHSDQGLNGQVYNRCVGTRYCENNCPYKVRRFNWFEGEWPAPLNLQLNPDVTVRGAGVMEKCMFCIQRIVAGEINAQVHDRKVRDGEIMTACQQACPTRAISFGDMNDPKSAMMTRRFGHRLRNYRVFDELNTLPGITYLREVYQPKEKA